MQADILVIDTSAARRNAYQTMLADLVGHVEAASPGGYAQRLLRERPFAAIVIHVDDPNGPHNEAAAFLQSLGAAPLPPIICVCADPSRAVMLGAAHSAPFDYLPLPVLPELLREKVSILVDLHSLKNEVANLTLERDLLASAAGEEKRAADALRRLVGQQVHRGKNLLAIMQSIALRTLNNGRDLRDARNVLVGRMGALARGYHLLTDEKSQGAELGAVIEGELGHVADRVTRAGPSVRLSGSFAQTFALAVHELATNATTHGALGDPEGSVAVEWAIFERGLDRYVEVDWTERGGHPVTAPSTYGFGLTLISSLTGSDATALNLCFDQNGFACRMRLPQDMIVVD